MLLGRPREFTRKRLRGDSDTVQNVFRVSPLTARIPSGQLGEVEVRPHRLEEAAAVDVTLARLHGLHGHGPLLEQHRPRLGHGRVLDRLGAASPRGQRV